MVPVEPISLTIGAVALASLFSLCVECFDLIETGKNLGSDGELLIIKLSIEKRRLMIWGEAVGILRPDEGRDPLLDEPDTRKLVDQILTNVQKLFYEADLLKSRYGLEKHSSSAHSSTSNIEGSIACTVSFASSPIVLFQTRLATHHNKTGLTVRAKWAIRDAKKFSGLVQNVKDLLDGLSEITTSTSAMVFRGQLIRQETEAIPDLRTLTIIENTCSDEDWRSSAGSASQYYFNMNRLTIEKRSEISKWIDTDERDTSADLDPPHQWTLAPEQLSVKDISTEVLVVCSNSTLKEFVPKTHQSGTFDLANFNFAFTPANQSTTSDLMTPIIRNALRRPGSIPPIIAIYCPPRMRHINLALSICRSDYRFRIRIDDRLTDWGNTGLALKPPSLAVTRTVPSVRDRMLTYRHGVLKAVASSDPMIRDIAAAIDLDWMERRIDLLDSGDYTPGRHGLQWDGIFQQRDNDLPCVGIIVLGGLQACADLFSAPPVRPPPIRLKEGRIFRLRELDTVASTSIYTMAAEHYCNVTTAAQLMADERAEESCNG